MNRKGIPDLWTLKNCEFFRFVPQIIGCAGAIAMNLTVCKTQVEKQWRGQDVIITVDKFKYEGLNGVVAFTVNG